MKLLMEGFGVPRVALVNEVNESEVWWCGLYDVRTEIRETYDSLQSAFSMLQLKV